VGVDPQAQTRCAGPHPNPAMAVPHPDTDRAERYGFEKSSGGTKGSVCSATVASSLKWRDYA
jgi:hypothetical protein